MATGHTVRSTSLAPRGSCDQAAESMEVLGFDLQWIHIQESPAESGSHQMTEALKECIRTQEPVPYMEKQRRGVLTSVNGGLSTIHSTSHQHDHPPGRHIGKRRRGRPDSDKLGEQI